MQVNVDGSMISTAQRPSVLQFVAVCAMCWNVLQCIAVCCNGVQWVALHFRSGAATSQYVAVWCSV